MCDSISDPNIEIPYHNKPRINKYEKNCNSIILTKELNLGYIVYPYYI